MKPPVFAHADTQAGAAFRRPTVLLPAGRHRIGKPIRVIRREFFTATRCVVLVLRQLALDRGNELPQLVRLLQSLLAIAGA